MLSNARAGYSCNCRQRTQSNGDLLQGPLSQLFIHSLVIKLVCHANDVGRERLKQTNVLQRLIGGWERKMHHEFQRCTPDNVPLGFVFY